MKTEENSIPNTYAKFWKCALQVNPSTYSAAYRGQNHAMTPEQYLDELVKVCLEQNIKVVGIADHGSVSEVDAIRKKLNEHDIVVFPGFEIATTEKCHWVCLFPENTSVEDLNRYLGKLDLTNSRDGVKPSNLGAIELFKRIEEIGGFCYAAHCTDENGVLNRGKNDHIWKDARLKAAQIPGMIEELDPSKYQPILTNKNAGYKREKSIGIINAKDVDKPETLKNPKCWCYIKMTHPGFEAFKVAFKDPESRIRLHPQMKEVQYSCIKSVKFVGGYLGGIDISFSSHLNTIIGGRGTGKSTLIELLRYVFNIVPKGKEARQQHEQIIKENLGRENGRIEIEVCSAEQNGEVYKVIRRYNEPPRIIDSAGNESELEPHDLLPGIEIYGQNEIYELARDNTSILRVLERFMPISQLHDEEVPQLKRQLRENAEKLVKVLNKKDSVEQDAGKLPKLQEQADQFRKLGIESMLKIIPLLEQEKNILKNIDVDMNAISIAIEGLKNTLDEVTSLNDEELIALPHAAELKIAYGLLAAWKSHLIAEIKKFEAKQITTASDVSTQIEAIKIAITKAEENVENEFANIPAAAGKSGKEIGVQYRSILQQIERIRPLTSQLSTYKKEEDTLRQERRNLLGRLADTRFNRSEELKKTVKSLNKKLKGKVQIDVKPESNREELKALINGLPGIGAKKASWVDETDNLTVAALAQAMREGKDAITALGFGITPAVAETLANLSDADKFKLEEVDLKERIGIKLNVARAGGEIYRELEKLSTGQQCTAILHLLLLENKEPLIMDQPEDNLDNAFIADRIVQELRSEKTKRQFIFATHNANIPVFGDAEWIGVFSATSEKAEMPTECQGSIDVPNIRDNVADILEGGKIAFIQRKEKYDF